MIVIPDEMLNDAALRLFAASTQGAYVQRAIRIAARLRTTGSSAWDGQSLATDIVARHASVDASDERGIEEIRLSLLIALAQYVGSDQTRIALELVANSRSAASRWTREVARHVLSMLDRPIHEINGAGAGSPRPAVRTPPTVVFSNRAGVGAADLQLVA